jgi:5'-methylthioadenosine phosphorylase
MTAMPEARLAREAELCYAMLAMVTDYDVWHESEADVSVAVVVDNLMACKAAATSILTHLARLGLPDRSCRCASALEDAIVTEPARIGSDARLRLMSIAGARIG